MSDLIKRLRASVRMDAINGDAMERGVCGKQMLEAADALERLRKDAERYRWLRGSADVPSHSVRWGRWEINHWEGANGWRNLLCSELDAAIDAAMQEKQP